MSTLTVSDIPLDSTSPAQRLRRTAAAVRVHFTWWGVHKTLTAQQKEEVGLAYAADARFLTAGKKLIDTRHEAFRNLNSLRSRAVKYWRDLTLPFTEPGVRLIRQSDVEVFVHTLEGSRDELVQLEANLNAVYEDMKANARIQLGRLFNPGDYPPEVRGLFAMEWDFPSVEPPNYLMRISPEIYQQEQERVARRFEEAVQLAEQAFLSEFGKLVSHLTERLTNEESGERRRFQNSTITNLGEFFERFRHLNVRSNPELDALVEEAQRLVSNVSAQDLRDDGSLRQHLATEMSRVQSQVEGMLVDRPRRQIIRPSAPRSGGNHAVSD